MESQGSRKLLRCREFCTKADIGLFRQVLMDKAHVLHPLLPPTKTHMYAHRMRSHCRELPNKTKFGLGNFIHRKLYRYIYIDIANFVVVLCRVC